MYVYMHMDNPKGKYPNMDSAQIRKLLVSQKP